MCVAGYRHTCSSFPKHTYPFVLPLTHSFNLTHSHSLTHTHTFLLLHPAVKPPSRTPGVGPQGHYSQTRLPSGASTRDVPATLMYGQAGMPVVGSFSSPSSGLVGEFAYNSVLGSLVSGGMDLKGLVALCMLLPSTHMFTYKHLCLPLAVHAGPLHARRRLPRSARPVSVRPGEPPIHQPTHTTSPSPHFLSSSHHLIIPPHPPSPSLPSHSPPRSPFPLSSTPSGSWTLH
jgi:hypothetical protein